MYDAYLGTHLTVDAVLLWHITNTAKEKRKRLLKEVFTATYNTNRHITGTGRAALIRMSRICWLHMFNTHVPLWSPVKSSLWGLFLWKKPEIQQKYQQMSKGFWKEIRYWMDSVHSKWWNASLKLSRNRKLNFLEHIINEDRIHTVE